MRAKTKIEQRKVVLIMWADKYEREIEIIGGWNRFASEEESPKRQLTVDNDGINFPRCRSVCIFTNRALEKLSNTKMGTKLVYK